MKLNSITVFCGSNLGASPVYAEGARALGTTLAALDITLIYGGTHKGLMGLVADAVLEAGGTAHGVINQRLFDRGHMHPHLTRHEITTDMRSRKARMAELADGFIALPGGLGTLEELFEVATLAQLGDLIKPSAVLNINGFYDPMRAMLESMAREQFMRIEHADMILMDADPKSLITRMERWERPTVEKWFPGKNGTA